MAKFKIIHTKKTSEYGKAEFYVNFIEGMLNIGDEFKTYDTHHPVKWTILEIICKPECFLKCKNRLGLFWDDQYSGAIVDTSAIQRRDEYKYPPMENNNN